PLSSPNGAAPCIGCGVWVRAQMNYKFHRLKVLVVDDNQHMRTLVSAVLQAFGVSKVHEARSGEEGWNILLKNPCDIIFVDLLMTGMTELDFAQKIRTAP